MGAEAKKKKKYTKLWVCLYLTIMVGLYLVVYALPQVTGALTSTAVLTYNQLKVWDEVTCYLVRDEQVYLAEKGGAVTYYDVLEGTKVRKGTKIADVQPASGGAIQSYRSERNGMISYFIDGDEGYFSPETMNDLKLLAVEERVENPVSVIGNSVLTGEPVYKLVNTDVWYAVFWVNQSAISKYKLDSSITLELPLGNIPGTISNIVDEGEMWQVVLKFDRYYEDMAKLRKVQATVVTEHYEGLLVPNASLVTEEGKLGVYVKGISGEYKFTRVKVITTDGTDSLVKDSYFYEDTEAGSIKVDTVEIYDEILKNGKP